MHGQQVMKEKDFVKKIWTRIQSKWLTLTGRRPYTELLDDVEHATSDQLDDLLKSIYV